MGQSMTPLLVASQTRVVREVAMILLSSSIIQGSAALSVSQCHALMGVCIMSKDETSLKSPPPPSEAVPPSSPEGEGGVGVGVPRELREMDGSLDEEQEVLWDPFGVVSLNGMNTGPSQEGLTRPPPVEEEEDPVAAAAEAVERGEEDSAAFEDEAPLGLPSGGTSIDLTDCGGF